MADDELFSDRICQNDGTWTPGKNYAELCTPRKKVLSS